MYRTDLSGMQAALTRWSRSKKIAKSLRNALWELSSKLCDGLPESERLNCRLRRSPCFGSSCDVASGGGEAAACGPSRLGQGVEGPSNRDSYGSTFPGRVAREHPEAFLILGQAQLRKHLERASSKCKGKTRHRVGRTETVQLARHLWIPVIPAPAS